MKTLIQHHSRYRTHQLWQFAVGTSTTGLLPFLQAPPLLYYLCFVTQYQQLGSCPCFLWYHVPGIDPGHSLQQLLPVLHHVGSQNIPLLCQNPKWALGSHAIDSLGFPSDPVLIPTKGDMRRLEPEIRTIGADTTAVWGHTSLLTDCIECLGECPHHTNQYFHSLTGADHV